MSQFHFTPDDYLDLMHAEVPSYAKLQDRVAEASRGLQVRRILELGTGTGETARRVLALYPEARLTGIDMSAEMLAHAEEVLPPDRVEQLAVRGIEEPLPDGPYELVVSALVVHHLDGPGKADLFRRIAGVMPSGGRFVMGDVVVPSDPGDAVTPLTPDFDLPSSSEELERWLREAGFEPQITWTSRDLAVFSSDRRGRSR